MTGFHPRLRHGSEEGAAATEFALLTLVLVPTLLYAVYFFEMSMAKIKAHEAARYMVWEMTAAGLSNWQNPDKHDDKFNSVKGTILSEVQQRWGDDLDGATPNYTNNALASKPVTIDVTFDAAELLNQPAGAFDVEAAGVDFGAIGNTIDGVFGHFGFNEKGKASGTFKIKAKNKFLGKMMLPGFQETLLLQDELSLGSHQSLIADQWDLKDGGRVVQFDGGPGNKACTSDYCKQVSRMSFLGISDVVPNGQIQDWLGGLMGFHWFMATPVASLPMEGYSKSGGAKDASYQLEVAPYHSPIKIAHTNAWYAPGAFVGTVSNDTNKVYQRLGPYYMGCNKAQQETCKYQ